MSDVSPETQLALLLDHQKVMQKHLEDNDRAIKALEDERTQALKWGVITLGSALLLLIGWIVNFASTHFPGLPK